MVSGMHWLRKGAAQGALPHVYWLHFEGIELQDEYDEEAEATKARLQRQVQRFVMQMQQPNADFTPWLLHCMSEPEDA